MSYNSYGENFPTVENYVRDLENCIVNGGYCELFAADNIFPYVFEIYYNNNLYAKFGVDTFSVKRLRLTGNINIGYFYVYSYISNILNFTKKCNC